MKILIQMACALVLGAALCLMAQSGAGILWEWRNGRILERYDGHGGTKLQFGLREDGVVVWREVTFTTNSPAEHHPRRGTIAPNFVPAVTITNRFFRGPLVTNRPDVLPPPLPQ